MGGYVLYKVKKCCVEPRQDIPKAVLTFLETRTFITDSDELKEILYEKLIEKDITKEDYKIIYEYFIVNQLFEFDLNFEWD